MTRPPRLAWRSPLAESVAGDLLQRDADRRRPVHSRRDRRGLADDHVIQCLGLQSRNPATHDTYKWSAQKATAHKIDLLAKEWIPLAPS